ncbi:MAG: hypothetical protein A2Z34_01285 [Planctomycetes bacterium RBG_16_59_8]|nr:MAG: hypothetical protein A2Z34_01285 [Planctomycetes bacterium RBG_16_59_8]
MVRITLVALLVAAAFAAGCAHESIPMETAGNTLTVEIPNGTPKIDVLDSSLAGHVQFGDVHLQDAGGIVQARVDAKNLKTKTAYCEYKVVFYDGTGFEIRNPSAGWTSASINGGESVQLAGVASAPGAKKCVVYLRYEKAIRR